MDDTIDLKRILAEHRAWLRCNHEGKRADLRNTDLSHAYLHGAMLSRAFLDNVDLRYADLSAADLSWADLRHTNLSYADLRGTKFEGAALGETKLHDARLNGADFAYTYLDPHLVELQHAFCHACPADADGYRIVYRPATLYDDDEVKPATYQPGRTYTTPIVSADVLTAYYHPGIYAGSLAWMKHACPDTLLVKCRVCDGDWFLTEHGAIRTCRLDVIEYVKE